MLVYTLLRVVGVPQFPLPAPKENKLVSLKIILSHSQDLSRVIAKCSVIFAIVRICSCAKKVSQWFGCTNAPTVSLKGTIYRGKPCVYIFPWLFLGELPLN